jgi:uncharacterized protein YaiE (UPF0345 family)
MRRKGSTIDDAIAASVYGFTEIRRAGKERIVRCFACGDSSNEDHGHLSITRFPPYIYKCQRCGFSGRVDEVFLKSLGVNISPEIKDILEQNKNSAIEWAKKNSLEISSNTDKFIKDLKNGSGFKLPAISSFDITNNPKYEYLCGRFGRKFSIEELLFFKVVLDLPKFARINMITDMNTSIENLEIITKNYISFLNYSGGDIISRNMTERSLIGRYYEILLKKSPFRFYFAGGKLDICNPKIKIYAAEGIFSIIGVINKFPDLKKEENVIFAAMLGKGITSIMEFMLRIGFTNQEVVIFMDSEIKADSFKKELWKFPAAKKLGFSVKAIYNEIGEDFGLPPEKIKPSAKEKII